MLKSIVWLTLCVIVTSSASAQHFEYNYGTGSYACKTADGKSKRVLVFTQAFGSCPAEIDTGKLIKTYAYDFDKAARAACGGSLSVPGDYLVGWGWGQQSEAQTRLQQDKLSKARDNFFIVTDIFISLPYSSKCRP